jgi:hypothetical protein
MKMEVNGFKVETQRNPGQGAAAEVVTSKSESLLSVLPAIFLRGLRHVSRSGDSL